MEKGYTLTEVVILFVIFITVAILFIPLTIDDAIISKNSKKWQMVQSNFMSIPIDMAKYQNMNNSISPTFENFIKALENNYPLKSVVDYKIKYLNGDKPDEMYNFDKIYTTKNGAAIAYKWFNTETKNGEDDIIGIIMYDVNGKRGPNIWGKDVFGMNVYSGKLEPFGKRENPISIASDCSKQGTGVFCSAYILKEE